MRLGFGLVCLYFLQVLLTEGGRLAEPGLPRHPGWWIGIILALYVFSNVVNIGLTRHWGRWPQIVVVLFAVLAAVFNFFFSGEIWAPALGIPVLLWLIYVYGHLGISFVIAAALATPGCEMRAIPHGLSLIRGKQAAEHPCPGPLANLDSWELKRRSASNGNT